MTSRTREAEFTEFLGNHGSRLRHAFIARYGPDVGSDVMGDVAEYAWKRWDKVMAMDNPSGWLYRVGQSRSRRYFRRLRPLRLPAPRSDRVPEVEPGGAVSAPPTDNRSNAAVNAGTTRHLGIGEVPRGAPWRKRSALSMTRLFPRAETRTEKASLCNVLTLSIL